jgi:hypothetical protein
MRVDLDLGWKHTLRWSVWDPDLQLNPDLTKFADEYPARIGAIVTHRDEGDWCDGFLFFDVPMAHQFNSAREEGKHYWQVESWDPLTLSPSIKCHCGDHGFVRQGRWVPA